MRGNPDGSLSSTVRLTPQGLLSFRSMDGISPMISAGNELETVPHKVAAGMNPAAIAAPVNEDGRGFTPASTW
jgi:hypothetical protein